MTHAPALSRRTVLRGLGTALALPFLDAMLPRGARSLAAEPNAAAPVRMAFFYVPIGIYMQGWTPNEEGKGFALPPVLEPLASVRSKVLLLSGLTADKARPNGDGAGDHARAASAFLTGCQARKTHGADIHVGVSVDQVAAERIGNTTRLPSLELGCDRGQNAGNCDSGYSCAYSANISWKTPSTPMAKEIDPRAVFERLFPNYARAEAAEARALREKRRRSVLDFVQEDAVRLRAKLGITDQRKLDEYFSAIREIEGRIVRSEREALDDVRSNAGEKPPALARPEGTPKDYSEHLRLLGDILAVAFQANLTRVATFLMANEGSNRSYGAIGVPDGHHDLSHHGGDASKLEKIGKINRFHMEAFAYFLEKLNGMKEAGGTVLDNSMILYGSGIGDGNAHNHDELPVVLAGLAGGAIESGRHVRYPRNTPLNNLFLSMLDRMETPVDELGDATGRLSRLAAETRSF